MTKHYTHTLSLSVGGDPPSWEANARLIAAAINKATKGGPHG